MEKDSIFKQIHGGLIVSCQALEEEPLHSSYIMGRMAYAAAQGGAVGIRSNSPEDILEIKKEVTLPVIGLFKKTYPGSPVYITPTMEEVDALMAAGPEIIAMDATDRPRPQGETIATLLPKVREKYPQMIFMADCATVEDGLRAQELGFDLVGTTLCGYTEGTKGTEIPSRPLISALASQLQVPLIAEGGIWSPEELKDVFSWGAFAAVVGTAITRPALITRRFVEAIRNA